MGANATTVKARKRLRMFQFTHPYRRRVTRAAFSGATFQRTRPYGRERNNDPSNTITIVFQSTRPYGANRYHHGAECKRKVSIHAPVWPRTRMGSTGGSRISCFNPRTRTGANQPPSIPTPADCGFNPRVPHGHERPFHFTSIHLFTCFNPLVGARTQVLGLARAVSIAITSKFLSS